MTLLVYRLVKHTTSYHSFHRNPMTSATSPSSAIDATHARVLRDRVILCLRLSDPAIVLDACRAAIRGGLEILELTLTTPGQQTTALEADISGRFVLRTSRTVSLEFVFDDGSEASKVRVHSSGGVSEASRVE